MKDFYYILGLDTNCTPNEIREAYRKLSQKFHPDLNQNDHYFERRFKEILEAYETLIDPGKRNRYDSALKKSKDYSPPPELAQSAGYFKTRGIDIAFTLALIAITFIFGDYVYKSINNAKATDSTKTTAIAPAPSFVTTYHKRKHKLKVNPGSVTAAKQSLPHKWPVSKVKLPANAVKSMVFTAKHPDTNAIVQVKPLPVADHNPKQVLKTVADLGVNTDNNTSIPNTAYIKGNLTGMVYMRRTDNYNSDVVVNIPNNSKVAVLEKGSAFCKVMFNNKTGYVPNWTVQSR